MDVAFLQKYRGKRIAVAVSGGMDSVCLLHVFAQNAKKYEISLSAITCEHGIRGAASERDVAFVKELCQELNVPLFVFRANVPERAKKAGRGIEEEGRIFRYECFARVLSENKADFVATAHHANDVAETVLFRLARGTSLAGVNAVKEQGGVIRPFLNVSKQEIADYMRAHGYAHCEDETNDDTTFARNAIRKNVLPALESAVPDATAHIAAFSRRAGEDDNYLQSLALEHVRREKNALFVPVSLARPLFLRACVYAAAALGCTRDYTEPLLLEAEKLKALQSGKKICLKSGAEAAREGDEIVFYKPVLPFPGEIPFGEGEFDVGAYRAVAGQTGGEGALYADYNAFPAGCVIRTRREGDVITPFGGKKKPLKEFLTDRKIPARVNRCLPLIAKGNEVFAVFGVEIADSVKVTDKTGKRVYLSVQPK